MLIEVPGLADGMGSDEGSVPLFLIGNNVVLGAGLHAAATGHAFRKFVSGLLAFGNGRGAGAEIIGAIDGNPRLDFFQSMKDP